MNSWWWKRKRSDPAEAPEPRIRSKYTSFRELLSLNNECLELLASIQEDLQYAPPTREALGDRIAAIFEKTDCAVATLERLTGKDFRTLREAVRTQRQEVESHVGACQELISPNLSAWLSELDITSAPQVGSKAATLGEIRNKLHLPVPDGYVLTAEAYLQFCGRPLWKNIRDATRNVDLNDLDALQQISRKLTDMVMALPVPRPLEVAIAERAHTLSLRGAGPGLAVRSSAVGEGDARTFAGQFLSLLNVYPDQMIDGYKRVVAGRFSERALFYRLSAGLPEVESPIAVLCLRIIRARASGIIYSRDPSNPKSEGLWVTATRGLGLDIASGASPADLFVVERRHSHRVLEQNIARKEEEIVPREGGGLERYTLAPEETNAPSLGPKEVALLAEWAVRIEEHFGVPQDVEWALDNTGSLWIVQSRPLALVGSASVRTKTRVKQDPLLAGGRSVYPGRVSGNAYLVTEPRGLGATPEGAILFLRKASPEIVEVFPRIAGLVAEWGNIAGHAAALLREFKIPSVFQLAGAFEQLHNGDPVSLDAVQPRVYSGSLWRSRAVEAFPVERYREISSDPISGRLLTLHLLDPSAYNFRPAGCKSTHDVLRFCHEKAIEAMFALNDSELERGLQCSKKLLTPVPINLQVLDLGGGLAVSNPSAPEVKPSEIVSRPFQALWRGVCHPEVSWTREMPASLGDLASVMATSLTSSTGAVRALGERSYLLVADEYMNLNSRLAYHFTLVDACVCDVPGNNYIAFRFAGGGAARQRRNLRASFIEACLVHYGFLVDRRGDLVNAWFKKAPADRTEANLDILGRLMACTSQLDMYMTSDAVMRWYVQQFLEGNYGFRLEDPAKRSSPG
ncbi:MAG: PEP/pyruvate-binding domain-containing protein [Candidatus Acidiferrum sp.]